MLLQRRRLSPPQLSAFQLPAPVRGLQLHTGITEMKADEALILDNYFPHGGFCEVRGGYTSHVTGIGVSVGTLMEWAGTSSRKMFAATSANIYDVSSAGAVGAAAVTSLTNAYWQHVNFTTSGGHFLVACNGSDSVQNYDGTTWTTPSITNVTSSSLINVASYKSRLWFVEASSTKAWYLGTSSISGAATSLELGDQFALGGKLQLIGSLSRDSGSGAQNVICFISSRGEVVVYQGSDPSDTNNWTLVGRYRAAAPIGNRALLAVDGDLGLLTERGVVSLKQVVTAGQATAERIALTANIDQGIIDDFASYGGNTGWQMHLHPRTRQMIVNVPKSSSTATQYAMNVQDGAWCTYGRYSSPLNATCWGSLSENLYFATSGGTVYRAENGSQDAGAAITAQIKTSYQKYAKGGLFRMAMVRPLFTGGGRIIPAIRINVDYQNSTPMSTDQYPGTSGQTGAVWGTGLWGTALWGSSDSVFSDWITAQGIGTAASLNMVTTTNGVLAKINAFDVRFERSAGMGL